VRNILLIGEYFFQTSNSECKTSIKNTTPAVVTVTVKQNVMIGGKFKIIATTQKNIKRPASTIENIDQKLGIASPCFGT